MLKENTILVQGERSLGRYEVEIARHTSTGWTATVPTLDAMVTNFRLVLQPITRRPYPPASIPSHYILKVCDAQMGRRKGVMVSLKTGHRLYLYISRSQGISFIRAVEEMLISPMGDAFEHHPAQRDLSRLIQFISRI